MNNILDIFNDDAFSVTSLVLAMKDVKYVPSRIGQMGLFTATGIDTLNIAIEREGAESVIIVPASARGGPGKTVGTTRRSMVNFSVPHFQLDDAIMADSIQGVRAFGTRDQVEMMQAKIAGKAVTHSQSFALTEEYHRLKLIAEGKVYDSDGTTVLFDFFTALGYTAETEIDFDLDNANPLGGVLRKKCAGVVRQIGEILDGLPSTGIHALCGNAFFDDLIAHPEVRETYKGYEAAATLRNAYVTDGRGGSWAMFEFGGITWENYRGGQTVGVHTDKCHLFPVGVPDLFKTHYAPADYIETVNTEGQRLYAKQWRMPNDKGIQLEYQTNAIHYCTRPKVLVPGRRT